MPQGTSSRITFSSVVTHLSFAWLALGGFTMLFASDWLLMRLTGGVPPGPAWTGQLLGCAWLAMAGLNWATRFATIGGIFARPVVFANFVLYFVGALSLAGNTGAWTARLVWVLFVPHTVLAFTYGLLLWRGPFDRNE